MLTVEPKPIRTPRWSKRARRDDLLPLRTEAGARKYVRRFISEFSRKLLVESGSQGGRAFPATTQRSNERHARDPALSGQCRGVALNRQRGPLRVDYLHVARPAGEVTFLREFPDLVRAGDGARDRLRLFGQPLRCGQRVLNLAQRGQDVLPISRDCLLVGGLAASIVRPIAAALDKGQIDAWTNRPRATVAKKKVVDLGARVARAARQ